MKKKEFPLYIDMEDEERQQEAFYIHGFYLQAKSDDKLRFSGQAQISASIYQKHCYRIEIEIRCQETGRNFHIDLYDTYDIPIHPDITDYIEKRIDTVDSREKVGKILLPYMEGTFKKAKQALKGEL